MWIVQVALRRPYTFLVMVLLILLATPLVLQKMSTDIFSEIDIPVISIVWNYAGLSAPRRSASASPPSASAL
jgi:multidrug efflux pump subunit AcrB